MGEHTAWNDLRVARNWRLAWCDWTVLPDCSMSAEAKAAWTSYRQALRDLPANTLDPNSPIWPTPPST